MKKTIFFASVVSFAMMFFFPFGKCSDGLFAQNVGINANGSAPNAKSILDIDVTGMATKGGLLVPRLTTVERDAITSPIPMSLLIFNTTTVCFEAYNSNTSLWVSFGCLGCTGPAQPSVITGTISPCNGTAGLTYSVTNVSGITYAWTVPTGWSITAGQGSNSITVTSGSTSGNIAVTPSNSCGTGTAQTFAVTVAALPLAVTTSGGGTFCGSATLTASGGSGGTIYWENTTSGGTSTSTASSSQSVSSSGTYYFRANNSCGWGTEGSATVTISAPAPGAVTVSGGGTFCGSATLTASGGSGGTIYWQNTTSGGTSTSTASSSQSISSSGTYYFRANNSCGWGTEGSATVTIGTPAPNTPGSISGPTTVTSGSNGNSYSIAAVSNATSYTWSVPCGATISSGQGTTSITVSYASVPSSILYNSPGTSTANCIKGATIEVVGPGGNGGGNGGGGGGGGGYSYGTFSGLSGASLTVTVGAGGSGTATSVGGLISASAGVNGSWVNNPTLGGGGAGGTGSGGTINRTGGTGGGGYWTYFGGGGAGAAGSSSNGTNGGNTVTYPPCVATPGGPGGAGGGAPGGDGGKGAGFIDACITSNPAVAGGNYGGGGGGGNGNGSPAANGGGGYCNITSITSGGNITVTASNGCGTSAASSLSVTITP